jgi:hypothetical protein
MVVTVVGDDGGAAGGGFAEHGGGCPPVTSELGLPVVVAGAAPDVGFAAWVQPAAPATKTAATAASRAGRNCRMDIKITRSSQPVDKRFHAHGPARRLTVRIPASATRSAPGITAVPGKTADDEPDTTAASPAPARFSRAPPLHAMPVLGPDRRLAIALIRPAWPIEHSHGNQHDHGDPGQGKRS